MNCSKYLVEVKKIHWHGNEQPKSFLVIVCNFKKMTVDVMKMTVVNMVSKLQQRFSSGQEDILAWMWK